MPQTSANNAGSPIDTGLHAIRDAAYAARCRHTLDNSGALVLANFFRSAAIYEIVEQVAAHESDAFYAGSTHNVYLTPPDPGLPDDHPFNRQVVSSKGLIADDEIASDSLLREVYDNTDFRRFLSLVLGIEAIYPYDDSLSSINVHFAPEGRELGWHFDNSSFAVTMLLRAPEAGGSFDYVPGVRHSADGDMGFDQVDAVLKGTEAVLNLPFHPGDLVLFRGRDALHRVTPTVGDITRLLVVFAFNDEPGVKLSDSALMTFYGRTN